MGRGWEGKTRSDSCSRPSRRAGEVATSARRNATERCLDRLMELERRIGMRSRDHTGNYLSSLLALPYIDINNTTHCIKWL